MSRTTHQRIVQKADPAARRRALYWLGLLSAAGVAAILGVQRWLAGINGTANPVEARGSLVLALWFTSLLTASSLALFGVYLWRQAARIHLAERFPLPGQPVIRDTVVLEGRAAVLRAVALRVLSILLLLAGVSLVVMVRLATLRLSQGAA